MILLVEKLGKLFAFIVVVLQTAVKYLFRIINTRFEYNIMIILTCAQD